VRGFLGWVGGWVECTRFRMGEGCSSTTAWSARSKRKR
jgi:hypothetical protein